jgi:hypothetical protein
MKGRSMSTIPVTNGTASAPLLTRTKRHIAERKLNKATRRIRTSDRPPYTNAKPMVNGSTAYYFNPPAWARVLPGCPVSHEDLGRDQETAYDRAWILYRKLRSFVTKGLTDLAPDGKPEGVVDWMCHQYEKHYLFEGLEESTKRGHKSRMRRFCNIRLPDGERLGDAPLEEVDRAFMDILREHVTIRRARPGEKPAITVVKSTDFNHTVKVMNRAWVVTSLRNKELMPAENPFSCLGLKWKHESNVHATWIETLSFVAAADRLAALKGDFKYFGIGTLALHLYEFLQRPQHACCNLLLQHYRPKDMPNHILVVHPKSADEVWVPLFRANGELAHPELTPRLEEHARQAAAAGRTEGRLIVRSQRNPETTKEVPWINDRLEGTALYNAVREVVEHAGLNPDISLSSFRHGGFTECGDSDFTDAEIRVLSRHRSVQHMPTYVHPTQMQLQNGIEKRIQRRATVESVTDNIRKPITPWSELNSAK